MRVGTQNSEGVGSFEHLVLKGLNAIRRSDGFNTSLGHFTINVISIFQDK